MKRGGGERRAEEALATKPANHRVTRSSKMMMQPGSSTIPVQPARHNKRTIAAKRVAKRVLLGTTNAPTYEALPEVPPKIKLPNSAVCSLSCSGPQGEGEQTDGMISPKFQSQTENHRVSKFQSQTENQTGENHRSVHISITEIAHMCTENSVDEEVDSSHGLVSVGRYKVRPEVAPLLERIFTKYGDIAKDCNLHSPASLTLHLDLVLNVLQTLQRSNFRGITSDDLFGMLSVIRDLENVKFNVGWLHKKISDIIEMKELVNRYPALKKEKTMIEEEEKKLKALKQKLKARKNKFEEEYQKLQDMVYTIKDAYEMELVDGLL